MYGHLQCFNEWKRFMVICNVFAETKSHFYLIRKTISVIDCCHEYFTHLLLKPK